MYTYFFSTLYYLFWLSASDVEMDKHYDKYQLLWIQYQGSWWWTVSLSETCRDVYQKLRSSASCWLLLKEYVTMHVPQNVKLVFEWIKQYPRHWIYLRTYIGHIAVISSFTEAGKTGIGSINVKQTHKQTDNAWCGTWSLTVVHEYATWV